MTPMNNLDTRLFLEFCQCLTINRDALRTHTDRIRASFPNYKEQPDPSTQRTTRQIGETATYFRSTPPPLEK
jgi:hypothetical protein